VRTRSLKSGHGLSELATANSQPQSLKISRAFQQFSLDQGRSVLSSANADCTLILSVSGRFTNECQVLMIRPESEKRERERETASKHREHDHAHSFRNRVNQKGSKKISYKLYIHFNAYLYYFI